MELGSAMMINLFFKFSGLALHYDYAQTSVTLHSADTCYFIIHLLCD